MAGLFEDRRGRWICTEIVRFSQFYPAASHHQEYRLQQAPALLRELHALYPQGDDWIDSTLAARANGYLGGYGTLDGVETDV